MKCREFQGDLAEYVAGRFAPDRNAGMQRHAQTCEACAREEAGERALRARFAHAPVAPVCPDLWPQLVSQRRADPLPCRPMPFRFWAVGSASALAALTGLLWIYSGPPRPASLPTVSPSDAMRQGLAETGMLQMVADLRQKPAEESDALLQTIHTDQNERSVLLGSRGKE